MSLVQIIIVVFAFAFSMTTIQYVLEERAAKAGRLVHRAKHHLNPWGLARVNEIRQARAAGREPSVIDLRGRE